MRGSGGPGGAALGGASHYFFRPDGALCPLHALRLLVHEDKVEEDVDGEDEVDSPATRDDEGMTRLSRPKVLARRSALLPQGYRSPVDKEEGLACVVPVRGGLNEGHFKGRDERGEDESLGVQR